MHRQIPVLTGALGSSCSEVLQIISDPPQGSENLLTQVILSVLDDLNSWSIYILNFCSFNDSDMFFLTAR